MPHLAASVLALPCLVASLAVCADPLALSCAVVALGLSLFVGPTGPDGTYLDGMGGSDPAVVDAVPVDAKSVRAVAEQAYTGAIVGQLTAQVGPDLDVLLSEITRLDAAIARAKASRHRTRAASYQTRRDAAWSQYRASLTGDVDAVLSVVLADLGRST